MIAVRRAGILDAREMAELLNAIIRKGGTTAFVTEIDRDTILGWFAKVPNRSVWHVAEDADGVILGFQSIEPHPDLPPDACDIATFVKLGQTGLGIGSKLFEASQQAAIGLGYAWINATIRADNTGGLTYYQSRGFEDYARHRDVPLGNGQIVDRISKRYDLT
ncbi:GNAT family N-acetyltransferase [Marivita hallyeonensis]|uniref:L-amino acid N-acyltransferase YncA n=1 Tax=Marivita hallyeonensis TaxID=996342 RepID=A0A1M5U8W8_9RHOB|nr:GNAT family N-acetyltransferase [Marivita hallyeonensis]SHH59389.1 L-amino acid N-acyltransferase YncA [Marivita hallyeonensis]